MMFEQWLRNTADESLSPAAALEIQARLIRLASNLASSETGDLPTSIPHESYGKAEQMATIISSGYEQRLTVPQWLCAFAKHRKFIFGSRGRSGPKVCVHSFQGLSTNA